MIKSECIVYSQLTVYLSHLGYFRSKILLDKIANNQFGLFSFFEWYIYVIRHLCSLSGFEHKIDYSIRIVVAPFGEIFEWCIVAVRSSISEEYSNSRTIRCRFRIHLRLIILTVSSCYIYLIIGNSQCIGSIGNFALKVKFSWRKKSNSLLSIYYISVLLWSWTFSTWALKENSIWPNFEI